MTSCSPYQVSGGQYYIYIKSLALIKVLGFKVGSAQCSGVACNGARSVLLLGQCPSSSCVAVKGDGEELLACSGQQDVRKAVAHVYLTSRACSNHCFL